MGLNCMSLAVWLGAVRKCSAAVVGLDLVLGLSMVPQNTSSPFSSSSSPFLSERKCYKSLLIFTAYHKAGSYCPAKFASVFYNSGLEDGRLSRENLVGRV